MAALLMVAIGAGVDIGRWLHARDQSVTAVDAGLLAGGRWLQTNNTDIAGAIAAAQTMYTQNVASRLPVINDTVAFAIGSDGISMIATGTAYIQTPFLQLANIDKLPLFSTGQQPIAQAQLAVGGNGGESIEVAMMLDITGSMAGQRDRTCRHRQRISSTSSCGPTKASTPPRSRSPPLPKIFACPLPAETRHVGPPCQRRKRSAERPIIFPIASWSDGHAEVHRCGARDRAVTTTPTTRRTSPAVAATRRASAWCQRQSCL